MARHLTPPPIQTLQGAYDRIELLMGDIGRLEDDLAAEKQKVSDLLGESISIDERFKALDKRIDEKFKVLDKTDDDHGEAVKAFRARDAQLLLLGSLAVTLLGFLAKWLLGLKLVGGAG